MHQEVELTDRLLHLAFVLQAQLAKLAAAEGLTLAHARLLGILRDHEPTMQQLAQHLDLEKSSLSGLVDRAEERGLVKRLASREDGRSTLVRITPLGRKLTQRVMERLVQQVAAMAQPLHETERQSLMWAVERMLPSTDR